MATWIAATGDYSTEMIVWWSSFPMLIVGLCYSIKHHFRQVLPILIFTIMLTLAYSVFRATSAMLPSRAQMQIFYFIFASVGYVVMRQRKRQPERALTPLPTCARHGSIRI